ncbi:MAG TPA: hypothetical protein VI248_23230 [Kineosporiaceae bacterium]
MPTFVHVESKVAPGVYHEVPADLYVTLNYKKDGACPRLPDPYPIHGDSSRLARVSYPQPVPKDVCEDWFRKIGVTGGYDGSTSPSDPKLALSAAAPPATDVCSALDDDTVYEFYVISTDHNFTDGSSYQRGEFVTSKRGNVFGG